VIDDSTLELERRIRDTMLREHGIAFGCWGIPEGAKPTYSRAEFYGEALRLGACTPEEYVTLYRAWLRRLID
jgi:hypothetical protein